jgi:cyclophilin family peptidyl-prolyl cis-trans isomerase
MSVLLETSAGDIVIDLLVDYAPKLCEKYALPSPAHSTPMLS